MQTSNRSGVMPLVGLIFIVVGLYLAASSIIQEGLAGIVPGVFGLMFVAAGLSMAIGKKSLYSPEYDVTWTQQSLPSFQILQQYTKGAEPLTIDLEFPSSLAFPASVAELTCYETKQAQLTPLKDKDMVQAAAILKAALVGLLAEKRIEVNRHRTYRSYFRNAPRRVTNTYSFSVTGENAKSVTGVLEERIISTLQSWKDRDEVREWPGVPTIEHLVWAIYYQDENAPDHWIIELVARDAVSNGWGTYTGIVRKRFRPTSNHLRQQQHLVSKITGQLENAQPQFSGELDYYIKKGIGSREIPAD